MTTKTYGAGRRAGICLGALSAALILSAASSAEPSVDGQIRYTDVAKLPSSGIDYRRTRSYNDALWQPLLQRESLSFFDFAAAPMRSTGAPGVAVLDYDKDGDQDIYVTNGPGTANSLYSNQLQEGRPGQFEDVAISAGVDATDMDSTGVCYGDIDNDADYDLYVVGAGAANRLYVNNGDGTFRDESSASDVGVGTAYSSGCSMGDVNGDGLLDVVVANTSQTWDNQLPVHIVPFALNQHNRLLVNRGDNRFEDRSEQSGITRLAGLPPEYAGSAGLTWAISMVDYDQDGDIDIVWVDDQGGYPNAAAGGIDKGFVHIMRNDGTGHFADVTVEAGMKKTGNWMGLSFGDINADAHLDMFITNLGDYMNAQFGPYQVGSMGSKWFLGSAGLTFSEQPVTNATASALGWGTVMADYDNDGDTDIVYHGGMLGGPMVDASNPGVILSNDGTGTFTYDTAAMAASGHGRRDVQGLARGDLNNDGFVDFVTVSDFDIPESAPMVPYSVQYNCPLDATAYFVPYFNPIGPGQFNWSGVQFEEGTLSIDLNTSPNGNGSVSIELLGTAGLLEAGRSNRDGVGAVVSFTPAAQASRTVRQPIVAGDSYASQSALTAHFGLGKAQEGVVEVLWPGGTRNRLYGVRKGEAIRFPEIPCSYADHSRGPGDYMRCVSTSLQSLANRGQLDRGQLQRFYQSALDAYFDRR